MLSNNDDLESTLDSIENLSNFPSDPIESLINIIEPQFIAPSPSKIFQIRSLLESFSYKSSNTLKKEYVRVHIIRKYKKALRACLTTDQSILSQQKKVEKMPVLIRPYWDSFYKLVKTHKTILQPASSTENGPATDGKSKRGKINQHVPKSFNGAYCKNFFSCRVIQEAFTFFIDFVFANCDPERLCGFFKYFCCKESLHNEMCTSNWLNLKEFFQINMFEDLEIQPLTAKQDFFFCFSQEILNFDFFEEELHCL